MRQDAPSIDDLSVALEGLAGNGRHGHTSTAGFSQGATAGGVPADRNKVAGLLGFVDRRPKAPGKPAFGLMGQSSPRLRHHSPDAALGFRELIVCLFFARKSSENMRFGFQSPDQLA